VFNKKGKFLAVFYKTQTTMIKALIIEDEKRAADRLQRLVEKTDIPIEIIGKLDSIKSAVQWLKVNPAPDLLFLDIQLSDGLSFAIFDEIEVDSPIIFTTAYDEYALKAFEINSVAYLLKPIKQRDLEKSIQKYKKFNKETKSQEIDYLKTLIKDFKTPQTKSYRKRFLLEQGDKINIVEIEDIAYFYTENKVVFWSRFDGQTQIINQSLDQIESEIDPTQFFRINRQYLIHLKSIKKAHHYFNYKLKLDLLPKAPNEEVVVSRLKTSEFKKWLTK
jgi:two-component system LytT family response regulator